MRGYQGGLKAIPFTKEAFNMKSSIKEKILRYPDLLDDLEKEKDPQAMIDTLAERYDAPRDVVEKIIAEWSAGREKVDTDDE
mgnify:CR=1 FL=1|tara:strand:- start:520 stop:765 length:246 start_codon:yes stop_codon:yes gene_type:complete